MQSDVPLVPHPISAAGKAVSEEDDDAEVVLSSPQPVKNPIERNKNTIKHNLFNFI